MAATMDDGAITAADVAAFAGAAEEITGHKYETIGEWLRRASEHAEALTSIGASGSAPLARRNRRVLVLRAQKNGAPNEADAGERWGCLVQDRPTRFIAASAPGRRGSDLVERAGTLTVTRIAPPVADVVQ